MAENITVVVPDIGDFDEVEVVEVLVAAGDAVEAEQPLISLESDKATMEVPSSHAGVIEKVLVDVGDHVSEGSAIVELAASKAEKEDSGPPAAQVPDSPEPASAPEVEANPEPEPEPQPEPEPATAASPAAAPGAGRSEPPISFEAVDAASSGLPYASPSVRRFARELGVDLMHVKGSGRKGRIVHSDVQGHVKGVMQQKPTAVAAGSGMAVAALPKVDFSKYGPVEAQPLSRIKKISGANLHRNWVTIPHVTQHDEADVTEMEAFRRAHSEEAKAQGFKLTPLVFLIKACVAALKAYPEFNSSLDADGESLVLKSYFHIGIAVDTPDGLVVPVIRDCDSKSLYELGQDLSEMSVKARDRKLKPADMQGGCFSISSLGGIGGTYFTPIINAPEVAILGVSRSAMKPQYADGNFEPRLMLPLSLSYDHRVIDGAAAARFITHLSRSLADIRRLLL